MTTPVYVYVAGPYTAPDPAVNVHNALMLADKLCIHGFTPFVPHLTHLWHLLSPADYEFWMAYDFAWLAKCDALVRMPGRSPGADREVARAEELGIPVYYGLNELLHAMTRDADGGEGEGDDDPEPENGDGPKVLDPVGGLGAGGPAEA